MASVNKKKKSKNSFMYDGGEKSDDKIKRIMFYNARARKKNKKIESETE